MPSWSTDKRSWLLFALVASVVAAALLLSLLNLSDVQNGALVLNGTPQATSEPSLLEEGTPQSSSSTSFEFNGFWETLVEITLRMLWAAVLGGLVAYRRRLTVFEHDLFHAHILLSVAGALMMLIVGNQLVRAFGLLGAASVVRYRYGLRNPRDASMLIIALGIGMATGVGLLPLAGIAAIVVFVFSRGLDLLTTRSNLLIDVTRPVTLQVRTTDPEATMTRIDEILSRRGIVSRLRRYRRQRVKKKSGVKIFLLVYAVQLSSTDNRAELTAEITDESVLSVRWRTDKPKKR